MATIKLASNLALDENGYANGLLTVIETRKTVNPNSGGKRSLMVDTHEKDCFELIFQCGNTRNETKEIKTAIFGMIVNPEPTKMQRIGSKNVPIYNKFTTVLMRLNILSKEVLDKARKDATIIDLDTITALFLAIKDLPVKFKPQKNEKGYIEPNLITLEVTGEMPNNGDI